MTSSSPDLQVSNHGSIFLVQPVSQAGIDWVGEHLTYDETRFWGDAVVVEPRYIADIVAGAQNDGLIVS